MKLTELREAKPADSETVAAHRNYAAAEKPITSRTATATGQAIGLLNAAHDYFVSSNDR